MISPFTPDPAVQTLNSVKGYYGRLPLKPLKYIPKSGQQQTRTKSVLYNQTQPTFTSRPSPTVNMALLFLPTRLRTQTPSSGR